MNTYVQFLHARYVSEYLLQQSTREDCGKGRFDFIDAQIAEHFAKLAEGLGYRVTKIEAEPESLDSIAPYAPASLERSHAPVAAAE